MTISKREDSVLLFSICQGDYIVGSHLLRIRFMWWKHKNIYLSCYSPQNQQSEAVQIPNMVVAPMVKLPPRDQRMVAVQVSGSCHNRRWRDDNLAVLIWWILGFTMFESMQQVHYLRLVFKAEFSTFSPALVLDICTSFHYFVHVNCNSICNYLIYVHYFRTADLKDKMDKFIHFAAAVM